MSAVQRDWFDARDHYYVVNPDIEPPPKINLQEDHPDFSSDIYDQLGTGSCTANAVAAACWYEEKLGRCEASWGKAGPSRLFIYWLARGAYRYPGFDLPWPLDIGCTVRDSMRSLARCGVCSEQDWPFDVSKKNIKPSDEAFERAKSHKIAAYYRLDPQRPDRYDENFSMKDREKVGAAVLDSLRRCLAEGYPVVFGFWYYLPICDSYDESQTPFVLKDVWTLEGKKFPRHILVECLPKELRIRNKAGKIVAPGHAGLAIGYDDQRQAILVRNSRGSSWSGNGVFWMPYSWITDYGATVDFWTIRMKTPPPYQAPKLWEEVHKDILGHSDSPQ
jgi:C1A family cysteine protease